jgi:hypothetical protein
MIITGIKYKNEDCYKSEGFVNKIIFFFMFKFWILEFFVDLVCMAGQKSA